MAKGRSGCVMKSRALTLHKVSLIPHRFCPLALVLCSLLGGAVAAHAQQPDLLLPPMPAPPPMKYIPDAVRAELSAARDAKARIRRTLELAEMRLAGAESRTGAQQFDAAAAELGIYQALISDAVSYVQQMGRSDGKTRDLFKLIEQVLYKHSGRIEAMRRDTPSEYVANIRAALNHTRDTRTDALNAFYGNTVLREVPPDKAKPKPQ